MDKTTSSEAVLLDRRHFVLSEDAFKKFTAMLETKPPWER
jgi:uncharacterized protein (DUF1778 family)